MRQIDNYGNVYDDELMHYGKKGMKWGKHLKAQDYQYVGRDRNISTGGLGINGSRQRQYSKVQAPQYNKPSSVSAKGYGANTKTSATAKALSSTLRNNGGKVNGGRIGNNEVTKKAASYVHAVPTSKSAFKGVNTTAKVGEYYTSKVPAYMGTGSEKAALVKGGYKPTQRTTNIWQKGIATHNNVVKKQKQQAIGKAVKKTLSSVKKKPSTISMGKTVVKGLFRRLFG